ncbi:Hypothetical predicted protein [Paramuricea clavata]|uniref:Uncharacterized protein n=1 Tax=Paramuricea clavata TaxID=317549 RepID=A0A6S7GMK0_PARCT|nr:Hypothetical predicted protein [Paramuricea clavata]
MNQRLMIGILFVSKAANVGMIDLSQEPCTSASCSSNPAPVSDIDKIENSEVDILASPETSSVRVECPTCFDFFEISEIADHTDCCADIWIGEVEHCNDFENVPGSPDKVQQIPELQQLPEGTVEENIKSILAELAETEISGQARINTRRTLIVEGTSFG